VLLTRLPLPLRGVRLACVKPAASVRSEPGSNSQVRLSFEPADHNVLDGVHCRLSCDNRACVHSPKRWSAEVSSIFPKNDPQGLRRLRFSFPVFNLSNSNRDDFKPCLAGHLTQHTRPRRRGRSGRRQSSAAMWGRIAPALPICQHGFSNFCHFFRSSTEPAQKQPKPHQKRLHLRALWQSFV
jgi:hypothetical protein